MKVVKYYVKDDIYMEHTDPEGRYPEDRPSWAIRNNSFCWSRSRVAWVYEPLPSNRDDEFFKDCRFSFDEASAIARSL